MPTITHSRKEIPPRNLESHPWHVRGHPNSTASNVSHVTHINQRSRMYHHNKIPSCVFP